MLNPQGYVVITDPEAPTAQEIDTASCAHCGAIIMVKPGTAATTYLIPLPTPGLYREVDGAGCSHCRTPSGGYRPVCLRPACLARCRPMEQFLDEAEGGRRAPRGSRIVV